MTTRTPLIALVLGGATLLLGLTACATTTPNDSIATQTAEETETKTPDSPQIVRPQELDLKESIIETTAGVKVTCLHYRPSARTYTLSCDWAGAERPSSAAGASFDQTDSDDTKAGEE